MRILGLDTATRATSVALLDLETGAALEARDDPDPGGRPQHTTRLLALIAELLDGAGWGWDELDRIAVGTGPGTFTGLRIGLATARALALARSIPLIGVSTLQSLAGGAREEAARQGCDAVVAVLDARRREVFAAVWAADGAEGEARLPPAVIPPQQLVQAMLDVGHRRLAVGDGAIEFRPVLERSDTIVPGDESHLHRVSAIHHCRLAARRLPDSPDHVHPEYLRRPDAELSLRAKPNP